MIAEESDGKRRLQVSISERIGRETVLVQLLSQAASSSTLDEAWDQYEAVLQEVRAHDLELLNPIEQAFDEGIEADLGALPARLHPMSQTLKSELEDGWSRLRARQLVEALRSKGGSLRALSGQLHVSAPYLSQLGNGAGPVPSARIVKKLEQGLSALGIELPVSVSPPGQALSTLEARIAEARSQLTRLARGREKPRVSVDFPPDPRVRKHLEDCFGPLADRFVDPVEGSQMEAILAALVSADRGELHQWWQLTRDEGWGNLLALVSLLSDAQRNALFALIQTIPASEPNSPGTSARKSGRPFS